MEGQTKIPNLTFRDFKDLCLQKVQHDNCLDLVDAWQDNILHSGFTKSEKEDFYATTIYFIQECTKYGYFIKVYNYAYLVEQGTFFTEDYQIIKRDVLEKIAKLENLVSASNDKFLFGVLKELKK